MLMWGGGSVAAARRAGRYGLGMLGNANVEGMQEAYQEACRQHGHEPGPIFLPDRDTPSVCFVADDVDKAWEEIGPYLLHDVSMYADWNPGNDYSAGFSDVETIDELRANPTSHRIYSVDEAVANGFGQARCSTCRRCAAACPPDIAWPYLKRVGEVVMAGGSRVTGTSAVEVYYDPYDFAIDDDPYPTWKRLRDEAPLYYNEKYNFYALSRYEDVARELHNWETYRSGHGTTMDIILSGIELPPGIILFEDPPIHDLHRRLLSRVFTPRRMEAIEPLTRQYCVRALEPLVGSDRFDFIADIGAQIPMRTIGYLLGIPEQNQETIRDNSNSRSR